MNTPKRLIDSLSSFKRKLKKVALVRGSGLGGWEMQAYTPLVDEFEITVVSSQYSRGGLEQLPFVKQKLFAPIDLLKRFPWLRKFPLSSKLNQRLSGLENFLKDFDLVHTTETFNVFSEQVALGKERWGYQMVTAVWENIPFLWNGVDFNSAKVQRRKQKVIAATDVFIAITDRAKEALCLEGVDKEKICVIPAAVDTKVFRPLPKDKEMLQRFNLKDDDFIILSVGILSWYKGMQDLLFSLKVLLEDKKLKDIPLKLVIVGKGEMEKVLKDLIKRLKLEECVTLIPFVPYEDIPKLYSIAEIFVLGSIPKIHWQEQFGMVLVEAMASGLPVVAAHSGSIPEVVGEAGTLFSPADYLDLADALRDLILQPSARARRGKEGRRRVEENFSVSKVSEQIRRLYKKLLSS